MRTVGSMRRTLVVAAMFFAFLIVLGAGAGLPFTYWHEISQVQAFEGETGVVLFVEVTWNRQLAGFLPSPPTSNTAQLVRIDVSPIGQIIQTAFHFDQSTTFNTNIAPIVRLADAFYMIDEPSLGKPGCGFRKITRSEIQTVSAVESDAIGRSIGLTCDESRRLDDFSSFDRISNRNGWRRLNGPSRMFRPLSGAIESDRMRLRVRFVEDGDVQTIVAESTDRQNVWSKPLWKVNARSWRSYSDPMPR